MIKRTNISIILLFLFSIVLAHNIIPHHHHDEISEINNHEHKHHHENKEHNQHNENNEPIGFFSHPPHIVTSTEFTFSSNHNFPKKQNVKDLFLIADLLFKQIKIPIKRKAHNSIFTTPIHQFYTTPSLRGPPYFLV